MVDCCPDFFIGTFSACTVAIFAVSFATWPDISKIVSVSSVTDVLSDCVEVARFASAKVWSCYNSVNISATSLNT